ncbi:hypothetical protein ABEB36_014563 [Hypothenemus hampei]|uniref:Uncharacterized protein n=1 Tax=Hypothenemus hampei TaxID=57062 RepID=A0ABD1E4W0_HYPHA
MDKFGRSSSTTNNRKNIKMVHAFPTNTLSYGENDHYDAEYRSICNLKEPVHKNDATNKAYVHSKLEELRHADNPTKAYVDSKLEVLRGTIQIMENHTTNTDGRLYAVTLEKIPSIEKQINDSNSYMMELVKTSNENIKPAEMWDAIKKLKEKKIISIST